MTISSSPHLASRALFRYSTPKKLANLALCQVEKRTKPLLPRSRPYQANIDLSNACTLRCPYCPTGVREFGRKPGFIDPAQVAELLDGFGEFLYVAYLFSWGEPLMHPKVAEIVSMVHARGVMTDISTHFSLKNASMLEAVCDAGLDHLKLSIDGATQEVYQKYRVGGKLDRVIENIRRVVEYKRRRGLRTPSVEWQFLVFDHNRHEVDAARELAGKLGVDVFRAKPGIVPSQYENAWAGQTGCSFLYDTIAMQVDGGIVPCCHLYDKKDDFVDTPDKDSSVVWHAERFTSARRLFKPELVGEIPHDLKHPCLSCSLAKIQPHLSHLAGTQQTAAVQAVPITVTRTIAVRADNTAQLRNGGKAESDAQDVSPDGPNAAEVAQDSAQHP